MVIHCVAIALGGIELQLMMHGCPFMAVFTADGVYTVIIFQHLIGIGDGQLACPSRTVSGAQMVLRNGSIFHNVQDQFFSENRLVVYAKY